MRARQLGEGPRPAETDACAPGLDRVRRVEERQDDVRPAGPKGRARLVEGHQGIRPRQEPTGLQRVVAVVAAGALEEPLDAQSLNQLVGIRWPLIGEKARQQRADPVIVLPVLFGSPAPAAERVA